MRARADGAASAAALLVCVSGCGSPEPPPSTFVLSTPTELVRDFETADTTPEGLPRGFAVLETNGAGQPATWHVEADASAPSGERILRITETRNSGQTYNLLLSTIELGADLRLAVHVRADRGEEDQGGGLVWRARGPDDYYVTRWNPLEDNLRAYHVVGGKRTQIASATVSVDPDAWHTLAVLAQGTSIKVALDGEWLLELEDATLAGGGQIGLWTKADAATAFDLLEVTAIE